MVYATASIIRLLSGIKAEDLNMKGNSELETWITSNIIDPAEQAVHDYCQTTFTDASVPDIVKFVANMLGANFLRWVRVNNMGVLISRSEFKLAVPDVMVLTDEMKRFLDPHVVRTENMPVVYEQEIE